MTFFSRLLLIAAFVSIAPLACTSALEETKNNDTAPSDPNDQSDTGEPSTTDADTNSTDPSDAATESDPSDASESDDLSDSSDSSGPDIGGTPPIAEPVEPCQDPEDLEASCEGAEQPVWSLEDFHPLSQRFGESYGLEVFEGTVTLVSLHAAWCSYCRTQALYMDQMLSELRAEGYTVEFITVNKINAAEEAYQRAMIYQLDDQNEIQLDEDGVPLYRCTYPLVQDTEEVNAWELHAGKKDDFYIYGTDGLLARFLPSGTEDFSTRLSTEDGYNNLKSALIEVLEGNDHQSGESEGETTTD